MAFAAFGGIAVAVALLGGLTGLIWGLSTSGQDYPDSHLDRQLGMTTASPARRLGGNLLDGVVLVATLVIGWFIWFAIVAPRGQTPGKALVSTYVVREDGRRAGGWYMWGREILVKGILFSLLNYLVGFASTVAAMWCLWDDDKQCLWDKVVSSYVAYSPGGPPVARRVFTSASQLNPADRLRELQQLRADGVITAAEYEERRQRLLGEL